MEHIAMSSSKSMHVYALYQSIWLYFFACVLLAYFLFYKLSELKSWQLGYSYFLKKSGMIL